MRPILPADRGPLASLLKRVDVFRSEEVDVALELIDEAIGRPVETGYACVVAVEDGPGGEDVLGYLCYGRTPMTDQTYDLYWIAVDPPQRGKRVGRALIDAFEATLRQRGGAVIRVETSSNPVYEDTLGFYMGLGYREAGRIPRFYRLDDDLVILYKHIEPIGVSDGAGG